jgi:hypothetical protein
MKGNSHMHRRRLLFIHRVHTIIMMFIITIIIMDTIDCS